MVWPGPARGVSLGMRPLCVKVDCTLGESAAVSKPILKAKATGMKEYSRLNSLPS
jgi:hypothetical protein